MNIMDEFHLMEDGVYCLHLSHTLHEFHEYILSYHNILDF